MTFTPLILPWWDVSSSSHEATSQEAFSHELLPCGTDSQEVFFLGHHNLKLLSIRSTAILHTHPRKLCFTICIHISRMTLRYFVDERHCKKNPAILRLYTLFTPDFGDMTFLNFRCLVALSNSWLCTMHFDRNLSSTQTNLFPSDVSVWPISVKLSA